jgi:hypothetical protein
VLVRKGRPPTVNMNRAGKLTCFSMSKTLLKCMDNLKRNLNSNKMSTSSLKTSTGSRKRQNTSKTDKAAGLVNLTVSADTIQYILEILRTYC